MANPEEGDSARRGPKGGKKHTPGRDHARKSARKKKKQFQRKAAGRKQAANEAAQRQWAEWDQMTEFERRLFPEKQPIAPRPEL